MKHNKYDKSRNYPVNDRVNHILEANNPFMLARNDKDRRIILDNFYKLSKIQQESIFLYILDQINIDSIVGIYLSNISYKADIILERVFDSEEPNDNSNYGSRFSTSSRRYSLYTYLLMEFANNIKNSKNYSKLDDLSVPFDDLVLMIKMHLIDNKLVSDFFDYVKKYSPMYSVSDFYDGLPDEYQLDVVI